MKKISIPLILCLFAIAVVFSVSVTAQGYGNNNGGAQLLSLPEPQDYNLTETEISDLLFMRSEEQMARDLYIEWSAKYSLPIFGNIAQAEETHTSSVQFLLDRYNLAAGNEIPTIRDLSASLAEQGDKSLTDALKAGVLIEEHDISDLDRTIANTTREDLKTVYENLRNGSESHLAAFTKQLS
jgi:hypothetical protein